MLFTKKPKKSSTAAIDGDDQPVQTATDGDEAALVNQSGRSLEYNPYFSQKASTGESSATLRFVAE